jgi:ribosomal protein L31
MKPEIHPDYQETVIVCACGATKELLESWEKLTRMR